MVLAAGEGTRLRPLTERLPKALCPVGNVPLLDRALARLAGLGLAGPDRVAVNACYLGDQVVAHVGDRAHLSVEPGDPLGTAGGVARLRDWIDGRGRAGRQRRRLPGRPGRAPGPDIAALLRRLGRRRPYACSASPPRPGGAGQFGGHRFAGFSLLPWRLVARPAGGARRPGPRGVAPGRGGRRAERGRRTRGTYLRHRHPGRLPGAPTCTPPAGGNLVRPDATVTGPLRRAAVVGAGAASHGDVDPRRGLAGRRRCGRRRAPARRDPRRHRRHRPPAR